MLVWEPPKKCIGDKIEAANLSGSKYVLDYLCTLRRERLPAILRVSQDTPSAYWECQSSSDHLTGGSVQCGEGSWVYIKIVLVSWI